MRIGYFTNQYPTASHTFIRREIQALERRGHTICRFAVRSARVPVVDAGDVEEQRRTRYILGQKPLHFTLSCIRAALRHPSGLVRASSAAIRFARKAGHAYARHCIYLLEALVLAEWCRREGVQHLHVHFGTNPATVAVLAHHIAGVPFSVTVHGPEEFDRPEKLGLEDKIEAAAFTVAVSSFGRSQLMRWAPLTAWGKVPVVPCGLDEAYIDAPATDSPGETGRLICIGRLSEQKGHLLLIDAAAALQRRGVDFKLVLAGDGPLRQEIESRVKSLGLQDAVEMLGTITQDQVRRELLRARALVLPSFAEGLPVVLMESMALRRPVISTYIAGIPELVRPDTGWLVPAGDVETLSDAMSEAVALDDRKIAAMGEAARARAVARHDIARSAQMLEEHIRASIAEASPASAIASASAALRQPGVGEKITH